LIASGRFLSQGGIKHNIIGFIPAISTVALAREEEKKSNKKATTGACSIRSLMLGGLSKISYKLVLEQNDI
jgi:hypothetical protein